LDHSVKISYFLCFVIHACICEEEKKNRIKVTLKSLIYFLSENTLWI
jgi:hypothetical protein